MKGSSANNPTSTKCFSGFLRSFLCTGSLPTHPSDQLNIESNTTQIDFWNPEKSSESEANHGKQATASLKPGVVARLMGLESFPASPLSSRQKTLGSYFRSRSVNSIDFLSQFDPVKQACHRRHRRVRTSVSFREVPSSLFVLDDKFSVVFPLDEVDETVACEGGQLQLVARKSSVIYEKRKMEKRARGKSRNGENFEERAVNKKLPAGRNMEPREGRRSAVCAKSQKKDFNGKTSVNLRERRAVIKKTAMDSRPTMKQVKKKKVHGVEKIHPEPTERAWHETCSNKHYSSAQRLMKNGEIRAISKNKTEKRSRNHEWTNMSEQVFKMTQESADEIDCDWTYGQISKLEDFEDICGQFGGQILEVLLTQIVHELVLL
ncbi:uncharacterized protein LOC142546430 isoform X2 [Primulina tabacum]|uniref:uncharacterized protein LOC142546430 isoform X2 n=1 Tax=Primulina tabacum TaxID=48773 RepID=UPI003F59B558